MKEDLEIHKIPSPVDLMLHTSLYQTFNVLDSKQIKEVYELLYFKGTLDCYCVGCGEKATFKGITPDKSSDLKMAEAGILPVKLELNSGVFNIPVECTRGRHRYVFLFLIENKHYIPPERDKPPMAYYTITKIGQYPSYSDINSESILKYRKVLDKGLYSELSKAIGLASHDIGVGSFVYLRRIFESLIEEAKKEASKQEGWDEGEFTKLRMDEKIAKLKDYLPSFLTEHPNIYSILSKGIHTLTEEECLAHFEVIKTGIELILDEKIERVERVKKTIGARKALQKAHQSIGSK
jgi:hypothetical protein